MKKLYFLLFLVFSFMANAQIVNIPDANFKAALLSANSSNYIASNQTPIYDSNIDDFTVSNYNLIDINGDNEIQVSEAENIKYLDVSFESISNLEGIQSFTNLISLKCNSNNLISLNISQNIFLKSFTCDSNQLSSLNISQNSNLEYLNCSYNQLTSLDVNQNISLKYLYFEINSISSIDISLNTQLINFSSGVNPITVLNFSNNLNLEKIYCYSNQLSNLDLTNNLNLKRLFCSSNNLTNIDLTLNSNLEIISCNNNQLVNLDFTNNAILYNLNCSNNPNLQTLYLKNGNASPWTNLNFSGNSNLEFVCCDTDDLSLVQQKILDYAYTGCQASNLTCNYPFIYEVRGNTHYDYYDDGCNEAIDDYVVPNVKYEIFDGTSTLITSGNQLGEYFIPLEAGNYTITPVIENPNYFNVTPSSFAINFPSDPTPFVQNICLTWNELDYFDDLEVTILPITPARPGFEAVYKVLVRNKGFDNTYGTVTLTYDNSILDYVTSIPAYTSSGTNSISWDFYSEPFITLEYDVAFNLNSSSDTPAVNINDEINFTAVVVHDWTDYTPDDNTFTLDQTVVGSYDPNDKTCLQGETEEVDIVGEYVHYLIRFENTGTYAAEKVVVEDVIDTSKFDIATLIPLHASHTYYTKITGNVVEFIFDNINLDFNDPNNDGYIVFKIKLLSTLNVGDTFTNNASIFFDSNPAIITNTYVTTIVAPLSNQSFNENEFVIFPNPAKEVLNIQSKNNLEINSIEIYNLLGQVILVVPNSSTAIDVSSLKTGTYFIKVNTNNGSANAKFIKK